MFEGSHSNFLSADGFIKFCNSFDKYPNNIPNDLSNSEFCFELAASLAVMLMEMKAELDDFAEMTHLEPEIELEGVH